MVGENPLANQDPHALRTLAEEQAAAAASGFSADDPARRFVAPAQQSYPFAYERVAQLFDSPNAPDLAISPRDWCQGPQPGTHGGLHVRQSRAPLWLSGPGVRAGVHELAARAVDIAPTCLAALGFPRVDGADATGRSASERGVAPDVYLARQDGRVLEEILESGGKRPQRLYLFLLDGMHQTELEDRLAGDPAALPDAAAAARARRGARLGLDRDVPVHHLAEPHHDRHGRLVRAPRRREPHLLPAREARDRLAAGPAGAHGGLRERRRREPRRGVPSRARPAA